MTPDEKPDEQGAEQGAIGAEDVVGGQEQPNTDQLSREQQIVDEAPDESQQRLAGQTGPADALRRGVRERERQLGRQELAGDPADAVGTEERARQAASAWRTAAACGPS